MNSEDFLQLSGIQHFAFCRRQWALAYMEQQWQENLRTAEGRLEHQRCHDETLREKRKDLLTVRGMRVTSHALPLAGVCDVVEFRTDPDGVPLQGQQGLWLPLPVEYKHGAPKESDADRLQLCAQGMALEEMLVCSVPRGALYYAQTHRREMVEFTPELREKTRRTAAEMNEYFLRGYTPKVRPGKHCNACSLKEICLPALCRKHDVKEYIRAHLAQQDMEEST